MSEISSEPNAHLSGTNVDSFHKPEYSISCANEFDFDKNVLPMERLGESLARKLDDEMRGIIDSLHDERDNDINTTFSDFNKININKKISERVESKSNGTNDISELSSDLNNLNEQTDTNITMKSDNVFFNLDTSRDLNNKNSINLFPFDNDTSKITETEATGSFEVETNVSNNNTLHKNQFRFFLNSIKVIKRLKDAVPFLTPVDTKKLNIPNYYDCIKNPMDLSTIEKKLTSNAYMYYQEVVDDFNLIVSNCIIFNGPDSSISKMAASIKTLFEKHMLNFPSKNSLSNFNNNISNNPTPSISTNKRKSTILTDSSFFKNNQNSKSSQHRSESIASHRPKRTIHPPKSKELPYDVRPRKKKIVAELRFCLNTIKELMSKKHYAINFPFLAPVDTVALKIPKYNEIIKEPMDLGTIQNKLTNNQYENGFEFEKDVRLVFKNCYIFNPEGSDVNILGRRLESVFNKKWSNKPVVNSTPITSDESEISNFENDHDSNEAQNLDLSAVQYLENQLARMKKELEELKDHLGKIKEQQSSKKKNSKKVKTSKLKGPSKTSSSKSINNPVITYEMKKQVSEMVPNLPDKKLQSLIKIIKDEIEITNEDEVELDMDQLNNKTILKLHNFLFEKNVTNTSNKKKKKKLSQNNAEELVYLRNQLALFDKNVDVNLNEFSPVNPDIQDFSDDGDFSVTSEEE